MRTKKNKGAGRPRKPIKEAREFGRQVEAAMKTGMVQARAFEYVRRRDPDRWGSVRKHYRLWKMYREDKAKDWAAETKALLKVMNAERTRLGKPDAVIDNTIAWLTGKPEPAPKAGVRMPAAWFFRWRDEHYPPNKWQ